jgi:phosphoglucosamine mutase
VIIGKDTRLSGYMMETALVAGFTSVGMDVIMTGPLPTPAIALLPREMRADLGVMISASHNPYHDNGIKLFGPDGFKLSDADEEAIERLMEASIPLAQDRDVGRARRIEDARGRYIHAIKQSLPHDIRFDSLKVVVDCATARPTTSPRPRSGSSAPRSFRSASPQRTQHQRRRRLDLARGDQGPGGRRGGRHRRSRSTATPTG